MEVRPRGLSKVLPNRITSFICSLFSVTWLLCLQLGLISLFKSNLSRSPPRWRVIGINQFVALLAALIEKFPKGGIEGDLIS